MKSNRFLSEKKAQASGPIMAVMTLILLGAILFVGLAVMDGIETGTALNAGVAASGTIVFSENPATDGTNFTIGSDIYEFDNEGNTTEGNIAVTIGANLTVTLDNIVTASSSGTESVTVTEDNTDTITITADTVGTDSNSITLTTGEATATVSGASLDGGVDADTFYTSSTSVTSGITSAFGMTGVLMIIMISVAIIAALMGILVFIK